MMTGHTDALPARFGWPMAGRYKTIVIDTWTGNIVSQPGKRHKLEDAIQKYIETCTSEKDIKNQSNEKKYFKIFIEFLNENGVKYVDDVTRLHLDKFRNLLKKKMKENSVNRRFCSISNFFTKCVDWKFLQTSPALGMGVLSFEENPTEPWTKELFDSFILLTDGIWRQAFEFLYCTGARPMELKNLRWTDIKHDQGILFLRSGKGGKHIRKFPIYKKLDILLHQIKMNGPFVFTKKDGKQFGNDNLSHACRKRLKLLGKKGFRLYGIRHGFASNLDKMGVSAFKIMELMGHKNLKTTNIYVHSKKNELIEILNRAI